MRTLVAFAISHDADDRTDIIAAVQAHFNDSYAPVDSAVDADEHKIGNDWNGWQKDCASRIDRSVYAPAYKRLVVVLDSTVVGKGNAGLINAFLAVGKQCYFYSLSTRTITQIASCTTTNAKNWKAYATISFV